MTDHDAIAARVRQDRETGTPGPWRVGPVDDTIVTAADGSEVAAVDGDYNEPDLWPIMEANARRIATLPDLEEAYLDLYDEVQRLRAERDALISMRDSLGNFWAKAEARAEKAEAERIAEWNKRRDAESSLVLEKAVCLTAEAERDRLRAVLESIAKNTCCEGCQEAALVARAALKGPEE